MLVAGGVFIIAWTTWTLVLYFIQKTRIEILERELEAEHECNPMDFEKWKLCKCNALAAIERREKKLKEASGDQVWDIN